MLENGLDRCTCSKKECIRHGNCLECITYHKDKKLPPQCKRKKSSL